MNLNVSYFENNITFLDDKIQVIEIENKKLFFRFINDLYSIKIGEKINELYFYDDKRKELNFCEKIEIYTNYFDLEINSKKNLNALSKEIINTISDLEKEDLIKIYQKIYKSISKILKNIDLPIIIDEDVNIENIIKLSKFMIKNTNDLLENLFNLIDLFKFLKINNILFFINLKQYLNKDELVEFYKYAIYNNIKICLIDSQSYGIKLDYENKLIIDIDLEEFVI